MLILKFASICIVVFLTVHELLLRSRKPLRMEVPTKLTQQICKALFNMMIHSHWPMRYACLKPWQPNLLLQVEQSSETCNVI